MVFDQILFLVQLDDPKGGKEAGLPPEIVDETKQSVEERVREIFTEVLIVLEDITDEIDLPEILLDFIEEEIY